MKAICNTNSTYRGLISDTKTYEKVKNGEANWKPHIKSKIKTVEIPMDLFVYFMKMDKEFAERLKLSFCPDCEYIGYDIREAIDGLLEEMRGEDK